MKKVIVGAAQYPIRFHSDFTAWQKHTAGWVEEAVSGGAEVLLFPEYGSMELVSCLPEEVRQDIKGQIREMQSFLEGFCSTFASLAAQHHVTIVAPSFPVWEKGRFVNRAYVFSARGLAGFQDKFFMTRFEDEEWGISSGEKVLSLFEADWGSFGVQICYDTEFGLGSQQLCAAGATLILAPSCTETIRGATRVHVGARARALENQAYVGVSQTIGEALWSPAVDLNYGFAAFYATPDKGLPEEGILSEMKPQTEGWLISELDFSKIETVRTDGQVFNFRDLAKTVSGLQGGEIKLLKIRL